ncbi:unnamed protein product [Ascophyllum nodosum]
MHVTTATAMTSCDFHVSLSWLAILCYAMRELFTRLSVMCPACDDLPYQRSLQSYFAIGNRIVTAKRVFLHSSRHQTLFETTLDAEKCPRAPSAVSSPPSRTLNARVCSLLFHAHP